MSYFKIKFLFLLLFLTLNLSFVFAKTVTDCELYESFIKTSLYDYNSVYGKSEKSYLELMQKFPDDKKIKKDYFLHKVKADNFAETYDFGKKLLKDGYENDFEILENMAYICINLENYEEAKNYLESGLELCKKKDGICDKTIYFLLGLVQYKLKNYEKALANFQEYYYIQPLDKKVIMYLAETNFKIGNFQASIDLWTKLKDKNAENYYFVIWNIANAEEKIEPKKAEEYYNEILTGKVPAFLKAKAYFKLGNLAFENREFEKAEYYFKQVLKKSDENLKKETFKKLVEISVHKKDYRAAVFYKTKFMKAEYFGNFASDSARRKSYIADNFQLTWFYDKLKNDRKSLDILQELAKNYTDCETANLYLGLKYYCLGDFGKVVFYIGKAEKLAAAEKKEFYANLKNKITKFQEFCEKNSDVLKYKNVNISAIPEKQKQSVILNEVKDLKNDKMLKQVHQKSGETARQNLINYLQILKTTDFYAKAKLKFSMDNFHNQVLLELFYSNIQDGKVDICLKNGFHIGSFYIRNKQIFADEKKESFFDISDKQDILKQFFEIFDFQFNSQNNLVLENKTEDGYIFAAGNYKFLLDEKGNLRFIKSDDVEIEFTKSINYFNLPTRILFKDNSDYLKFQFLNFSLASQDKQNLDGEVEKLNENKCQSECKN